MIFRKTLPAVREVRIIEIPVDVTDHEGGGWQGADTWYIAQD